MPPNYMQCDLLHVLISYTIYFSKVVGGEKRYYRDYIPGEVLDISCAYPDDRKSDKFQIEFANNPYIQLFT